MLMYFHEAGKYIETKVKSLESADKKPKISFAGRARPAECARACVLNSFFLYMKWRSVERTRHVGLFIETIHTR